jgi:hypothetical protein
MNEVDKLIGQMEGDKLKTELKKEQFIKQIKTGLGEHIKNNGNKVIINKKSWLQKFWEKIIKLF